MSESRTILIISGLDPGGGAGFIADVRVAAAHGFRAAGVVTAVTEQNTRGVRAVHPVPAEVVRDQLQALLSDVAVVAVKIGMIAGEATARAIAEALALTAAPVVWDPVVCPTRGHVRLFEGGPAGARAALRALASDLAVITPNAAEAALLAGEPPGDASDASDVTDVAGARRAGERLRALGCPAALITGGHLAGRPVDVLVTERGAVEIDGDRVESARGESLDVHGTGCALSTALACELARGADLESAARRAKAFVADKLRAPVTPGRGAPSVV